ncbi:hypothetical protein P7C73_g2748, partial [Tremellales sp. Uapishka_1]
MPVPTTMNGAVSPTSPRMSKAAFFRARSPPIAERQQADLNTMFSQMETNGDERYQYSSESRNGGQGMQLPPIMSYGTTERETDDPFANTRQPPLSRSSTVHAPPTTLERMPTRPSMTSSASTGSSPAFLAGLRGALSAPNSSDDHGPSHDYEHHDRDNLSLKESAVMGIAGGSDEMLMTLLAGQAAVDCETLPIAGWEEVESWKKELSLLSNRLDSLVARHQREVKILTAARTLQKLNNSNKRMSKQTMESLEQSEKRVESAEKEVLVLRDREAALRRRLMEHWSGVMAWEVRRLERVASETQARFNRQSRHMSSNKDKELQLARQIEQLESDLEGTNDREAGLQAELDRRAGRVVELEEMVVEMGRRERAIEEEIRAMDQANNLLEREKQAWEGERGRWEMEGRHWGEEKRSLEARYQNAEVEKKNLLEEREALNQDRQRLLQVGTRSERDTVNMDRIKSSLGGILGRREPVAESMVVDALEEVKSLVETRNREIGNLRDEVKEVNMGLEAEIRRVSEDRDGWKARAERGDQGKRDEIAALERQLRSHSEQISDLSLRNESLSTSLTAAQQAVSKMSSPSSSESTSALQSKVAALTTELETIAGQFNSVWALLPHPDNRKMAGLVDITTGSSNSSLASPSKAINFAAMQQLYTPRGGQFEGIDEMLNRVRGMVDDGKVLVERVVRLGKERELLKSNAVRAQKLVEDSRHSLETYQQQVAVLEDRLATTGSSESRFLDELNELRGALDRANVAKRQLEQSTRAQAETCDRLSEANDSLSARALTLAEDAEEEKRTLQRKLEGEIEALKKKLRDAEEDVDEAHSKGQAQRIQLLDELNSLQAEVADLRRQLRAAKG